MAGHWKIIWITGGSSGIGRQLALDLAAAGATVAISAHPGEKLTSLAASQERIHAYPLDVTDLEACRRQAAAIEADLGPLDLVIPAAGVWLIHEVATFSAEDSAKAMRVNYEGTVNIIDAVLPSMLNRGRGHIAPIASVAGYRGVPRAASYAPTKAALISLAETLRTDAAQYGIIVSIINPGYVRTPMTEANDFPMPFIVEVDEASRRIINGLKSGRFEIVFPLRLMLIMKLMRLLPYRIYFSLIDRFVQHGPHGLGGNK